MDSDIKIVQFYLNLNKDKEFIAYILHLAKQIKQENKDFSVKYIRVIIDINRRDYSSSKN